MGALCRLVKAWAAGEEAGTGGKLVGSGGGGLVAVEVPKRNV